MKLRTWTKKDIAPGARVLVRVDLNVPVVGGRASDSGTHGRIAQACVEIARLRDLGARIILLAHRGEPRGLASGKLSLRPMAAALTKRLKQKVVFSTSLTVPDLDSGDICLLENLRFQRGEEHDSDQFAKRLAKLGDLYINNAFGVCHREHASVHAITRYLPSFAGELVVREVAELLRAPKRPYILLLGGAKLATKIPLISELGRRANAILLGGGLAVTCLTALGVALPTYPPALTADTDVELAKKLLHLWGQKIILPTDLVARPKSRSVVDIGPQTTKKFISVISQAKEVLWNGPLGIIEQSDGRAGSLAVAKAIAKQSGLRSVVGGGETVELLESAKLAGKYSHVSTGGGAMLALLSGQDLPGLRVLLR